MTKVNQHKSNRSNPVPVILIFGGAALMFALVIGLSSQEAGATNTNPRTGQVRVTSYIDKICDGKNLIYTVYGNGIAVSPNDKQCT